MASYLTRYPYVGFFIYQLSTTMQKVNQSPAATITSIQKFAYEGSEITFANGENVMINATQMAKKFGKRTDKWLHTQEAQDFISALSDVRKRTSADLLQVKRGGKEQGTWMHEDLALEFARWLSPKFGIWCNDRIKELMQNGVTVISEDTATLQRAMLTLQNKLDEQQQNIIQLQHRNEKLGQTIEKIAPFVDYVLNMEETNETYTFTQVSNFLRFPTLGAFCDWAVSRGIIERRDGKWIPRRQYRDVGLFSYRQYSKEVINGLQETITYTVITEQGRRMMYKMIMEEIQKGGEEC